MFKVGDTVVNTNGITCIIDRIERMKTPYSKTRREYYVMHDIFNSANVYYIPTVSERTMRSPLSFEEAQKLIENIPQTETVTIKTERFRDNDYREYLKSNSPYTLVGLVKYFNERKTTRASAGKTLSSIDEKYLKITSKNLFSELAYALSVTPDEAEKLVYSKINN